MMDVNRRGGYVGRAARGIARAAGLLTVSVLAGGCSLLPFGRRGAGAAAPQAMRPDLHEVAVRGESDCLAVAGPPTPHPPAAASVGEPDAPAEGPGCSACACTAGHASAASATADILDDRTPTGEAMLQRLMDGNKRFAEGEAENPYRWPQRPGEESRHHRRAPEAVVLACADWAVPPEAAFDTRAGELFVVRVAASVAGEAAVDSARHAVGRYDIPLIVVVGHAGCGAIDGGIGADADPVDGGTVRRAGADADAVVAAGHADATQGEPAERDASEPKSAPVSTAEVERAVRANVDQVVARLRRADAALGSRIAEGRLTVVGAYYDETSGLVTLESDGHDAAERRQVADAPGD